MPIPASQILDCKSDRHLSHKAYRVLAWAWMDLEGIIWLVNPQAGASAAACYHTYRYAFKQIGR